MLHLPKLASRQLVRAENCSKCRYSAAVQGEAEKRQCRLNPPTATFIPTGPGTLSNITGFPMVTPADWCGQFKGAIDGVTQ